MSERYIKLFSLPENLYVEDCPVMICAGALSKDTTNNKVFVQLRFQNIDNRFRNIVAVKVAIQALDVAENPLGGEKEYQYLDVKIRRGKDFGSKQPVFLEDNTSRSFSVSVLEVVFEGGEVWSRTTQSWRSLRQKKLEEKYDAELVEQYQRDTFVEAKYEPIVENGLWMCACGALNATGDSRCCRCDNEKLKQFTALDHHALTDNLQAYTAKEMAEKEKTRKTGLAMIGISVLMVLAVILCLSMPKIILNIQNQSYIGKLVGTSWRADIGSITFSKDGTVDGVDAITSATFFGRWEMIDIANRQYNIDGTPFSGKSMRIGLTENGETAVIDVWFIDDTLVLVFDPEGRYHAIVSFQK